MSKTDWINSYGRGVRRYQAGGPMEAPMGPEAGAPAGPGAGAPDLEGMIMEYAETRDPQLAVAIADALVEMLMAQAGGPAGPGAAPAGPPAGPEGAPMARQGGRIRSSRAPIFRK